MKNPTTPDIATLIKTLTDKVEQIDRRTSAIAATPSRYYADAPEAAPPRRASKRPRKAAPKAAPIADQILELVQDEPRTGPELSEIIGSPRSSVNQAVHQLVEQRKVFVWTNGRGRGSMSFVFPRGYAQPAEWIAGKLGWERVGG